MNKCYVSLNQLVAFSVSSPKAKQTIIRQQKTPSKLKIAWYQLSKARIKKYLENPTNLQPIYDALSILQNRSPETKNRKIDRQVSIEALERFILIRLPTILEETQYTTIKPLKKSLMLNGVEVIIAPEIVIKGTFNGTKVVGAIKIHISKNNTFDLQKAEYVSTAIYQYLKEEIASADEIVLPGLCLCLDVFSGRFVSPSSNINGTLDELKNLCSEYSQLWQSAS